MGNRRAAMLDGAFKRPEKVILDVTPRYGFTYTPVGVLPYDPDYGLKRGRKWQTGIVPFSPILEQRFVMAGVTIQTVNAQWTIIQNPLITYEIGYNVAHGDLLDPTTKAASLWAFFNSHRGRATLFWFYDPVVWTAYPEPYRSQPSTRLTHPTDATISRYIAMFDEDQMSSDVFQWRMMKTQLKLSMYPG
jgi:hypothetical protein